MVAGVDIDVVEDVLGLFLAVLRHQSLHQQPGGGGGLHVGDGHKAGIGGVSQVLQAGGHGEVVLGQHLGVHDDGPLLGGDGGGVVGDLLQGVHGKGQGEEHGVLVLGALEVEGAHGDHVGLQVGALSQELAPQLGGAEGLEHVLPLVAVAVQGVLHGGDGFLVGVGIDDHLLCGGVAAVPGAAGVGGGVVGAAAASQKGCGHGQGQAQSQ